MARGCTRFELKQLVKYVFGEDASIKLAGYKPNTVTLYRIEKVREEAG